MKKIFAATAFNLSIILVGITGQAALLSVAHAEETIQSHQAVGVVKSIDKEKGRVKIAHDPVPSLNWPSMTMGFGVSNDALLDKLKSEHKVKFIFVKSVNGKYVITQVSAP